MKDGVLIGQLLLLGSRFWEVKLSGTYYTLHIISYVTYVISNALERIP